MSGLAVGVGVEYVALVWMDIVTNQMIDHCDKVIDLSLQLI